LVQFGIVLRQKITSAPLGIFRVIVGLSKTWRMKSAKSSSLRRHCS
jgi:hypothetical protein